MLSTKKYLWTLDDPKQLKELRWSEGHWTPHECNVILICPSLDWNIVHFNPFWIMCSANIKWNIKLYLNLVLTILYRLFCNPWRHESWAEQSFSDVCTYMNVPTSVTENESQSHLSFLCFIPKQWPLYMLVFPSSSRLCHQLVPRPISPKRKIEILCLVSEEMN